MKKFTLVTVPPTNCKILKLQHETVEAKDISDVVEKVTFKHRAKELIKDASDLDGKDGLTINSEYNTAVAYSETEALLIFETPNNDVDIKVEISYEGAKTVSTDLTLSDSTDVTGECAGATSYWDACESDIIIFKAGTLK